MKQPNTFNVYDAKTHFSKLLQLVDDGEVVIVARSGKPSYDITLHKPSKNKLKFGSLTGVIALRDEDLASTNPEIKTMFYGKDWAKQ